MQEPHKKGLANHLGPESCAGGRKVVGEALTGEDAGQPLSSEITSTGVPTSWNEGEGNTKSDAIRKPLFDAAESETLSMRGSSMRENRETPAVPLTVGGEGRSEKAASLTSGMHVAGESDDLVVPAKQANKVGQPAAAESVEGRGSTKGNVFAVGRAPDSVPDQRVDRLEGVRQVARRDKKVRFTALLHHVTPELLLTSFYQLKREASPGVDGVTWEEYDGDGLLGRINDLHDRVHRGTYRAKPSKRAWIPKADGRKRPLGIASLEDKIVQQAVKTVLEQVYEEDFVGFSYGFRPGRNPHNALDALWVGLDKRKVNWVLDADIRGFFDAIDHAWLMKFLGHRIADRRILRLIRKWLRAGVSDDGTWSKTTVGTPQGAVISPLLANVYLHYVLDLWAQHWRKHHAQGDVIVVRYADDFVMGFQHRTDAERCLRDLRERFAKFGLELHPDKTRLIEFGRFAAERRAKRGLGKPETFIFLGFTHQCGKTRRGAFTIKRQSAAKRVRAKLQEIKTRLRRLMHDSEATVGKWLRSVLQGWFNYHAVPGNRPCLDAFRTQLGRLWLTVLRRRSQKGRGWTWERMSRLIRHWLPSAQILHPYPNQRLAVPDPR
jgi:group II intron reverse transcriptase/maturase